MAPHTTEGSTATAVEGTTPEHWIMGRKEFERRMPHHDGIKALWETRWRLPCSKSVYPFHDGAYEDFAPIFEELIKRNINDACVPSYTEAFLPTAERLASLADKKATASTTTAAKEASALYLRACAVYRIARFPYITAFPEVNDAVKWRAWQAQKETYLKAGQLWECPVEEVLVDHKHAKGNDKAQIPVYVRVPKLEKEQKKRTKCPVVVLMTGLDGYRPDNTVRCDEFLQRGWGSVVVEIPGTADCPADSADPQSPDRLWTSLLEWMGSDGRFDMKRVMVWGLSCGGYYAIRIAHTHRDRLVGCVAQGAGCHYFFDKEWLEKVDGHEYPFELTPAMAMKHGFKSVDEYKAKAQKKFSLLETGIIQRPSTRLLLVNGTQDGLMPVEDSMMLFEYGTVKEARFFSGALHMGYPLANGSVYPWMEEVMASVRD
ncbi:hypothetical protein MYCTH_2310905 [Thermothelomyces thermophilus ATCC 42464]|uniref:Pigment biosynthesis protein Ayg1 n=1 Tax=Thermothelomyces thermophilus (strain ATCC 42464 / BCRC 31852 / DSM 1799) TaxID=573729 RepID=G2QM94_THET4|nr:uncharacterized protein MYCTH_2310905 [Thermothelomyces thermophilus ATCC 42464]AEO61074.1 hypothetical protein MYCTH_2310905 [Thermothelomyces thermophilus ATCC 42464]